MKKLYVCLLAFLGICISCYDDKGNYDYREINDVTIEGISRDKVYELFAYQSTLEITPVIHSTIGDGADYEYTWRIVPRNATDENGTLDKYVVSHEKNLVYPVQLEDGDYTGFFEVKDPETGVTWIVDFYMHVKSQGSEGWLAVCEDNGRTRLDLIGKNSDGEDVLFADLWRNNDFEMGSPRKFFFVGDNYGSSFRFPILTTDKGTYSIMGNDFHIGEDTDMKWYFGLGGDRVDIMQTAVELYTVSWIPDWWVVNEKGEIIHESYLTYKNVPCIQGKDNLAISRCIGIGCSQIFTKEVKQKMLPFTDQVMAHDWLAAFVANEGKGIFCIQEPLLGYRLHNTNVFGGRNLTQNLARWKEEHGNTYSSYLKYRKESVIDKAYLDGARMCSQYARLEEDKKWIKQLIQYYENLEKSKYINWHIAKYFKFLKGKNLTKKMIKEILIFHLPILGYVAFKIG